MASVKVSLLGDERSLVRSFKTSTKAAEKFNRSMVATGKSTSKSGRSFANIGRLASRSLLGGVGVAAALGSTVNKAGDFERSLNVLQATSGATAGQMAKVSAVASKLGGDITLPATSAKDAADAMLELTKGGLSVTGAMAAAKGTLQLAAAGQLEGAQAAQIQANALSQFNLAGSKAGLVADVLANTANAASGDVTDMATALGYVGPIAAGLGVSITNVGGAIGLLAKNGILGEKAGTALRGVFTSLAHPSPKAAKGLKTLGIQAFDAQGKFKGLRPLIAGLADAQGRLTQKQFTGAAAAAFGREPLSALIALAREGGPAFDKMSAKVGKQGGAAALAAAQNKGFKGAMDGLKSAVETLQIAIGLQLLPTVTKNVRALSTWLSSTRNQAKIMDTLRQAAALVRDVLKGLHTAFRGLNAVTGGAKHTIELLVGAYIVFKGLAMASAVGRIAASFGLLRTQTAAATAATKLNTIAAETNAGVNKLSPLGTVAGGKTFGKVGGLTTVATTAATATTKVSRLKTLLGALRAQPIIPITIAAVVLMNKKPIDDFLKGHGLGVLARHDKGLVPLLKDAATSVFGGNKKPKFEGGGSLGGLKGFLARARPKKPKPIFGKVSNADTAEADAALTQGAAEFKKVEQKAKVNFEQRNQFFDALIGRRLNRVQDISGTGGQLAELKRIAGQIKARIAATKDITRKLTLEDQLLDITRQEKGLRADQKAARQQAKQEAAAKKKAAAEKRIALAEKRRAALTAKQFFTLGLDATGGERVPFKKTLSRQLGTVSEAVKGTFLDTPKTRSLLARIRKVLKQGIVPTDVRAKVKEMLAGINDELKNGAQGHTKFKKANTDAMLEGLGLSGKQIALLRGRLSQVGAGGAVHGRGSGAFGTVLPGPVVVHNHTKVDLDGQTIAVNTTKHQAARRATSRRG